MEGNVNQQFNEEDYEGDFNEDDNYVDGNNANFMPKGLTCTLISLMGEPLDFMTRLDNTANATDKKRIYEEILGHLQEAGYRGQQAKQIEIKWKNLQQRFRKEKHKTSGDNAPSSWTYFKPMQDAVGTRRKFTRAVVVDSLDPNAKQPPSKRAKKGNSSVHSMHENTTNSDIAEIEEQGDTDIRTQNSEDEEPLVQDVDFHELFSGTHDPTTRNFVRPFSQMTQAEKTTYLAVKQLEFAKETSKSNTKMMQDFISSQKTTSSKAVESLDAIVELLRTQAATRPPQSAIPTVSARLMQTGRGFARLLLILIMLVSSIQWHSNSSLCVLCQTAKTQPRLEQTLLQPLLIAPSMLYSRLNIHNCTNFYELFCA